VLGSAFDSAVRIVSEEEDMDSEEEAEDSEDLAR